jgi:hypothetical protein
VTPLACRRAFLRGAASRHRRTTAVAALLASTVLFTPRAFAQQLDSLTAGATIRIRRVTPWPTIRGTYLDRDSLGLYIRDRELQTERSLIPRADIRDVAVYAGVDYSKQSTRRNLIVGGIISGGLLVAGVLTDVRANRNCTYVCGPFATAAAAGASVIVMAGSFGLGLIQDRNGHDAWRPVPTP